MARRGGGAIGEGGGRGYRRVREGWLGGRREGGAIGEGGRGG